MLPFRARLAALLVLLPVAAVGLAAVSPTPAPVQDLEVIPPERSLLVFRTAEHGNAGGSADASVYQLLDEVLPIATIEATHDDFVSAVKDLLLLTHDAVLVDNDAPDYTWCFDNVSGEWTRYCHRVTTISVRDLDDARGPVVLEVGTSEFRALP
jgi:hypothetical protein